MNQKGFVNIAVVVLIVVLAGMSGYFILNRQSPSPTPAPTPELPRSALLVNNFEDCVKAGYPTGKSLPENWERCWTIPNFQIFVKGLKPTIHQGIYGKITHTIGDCMPRIAGDKSANTCSEYSVDRKVYIVEPVTRDFSKRTYTVGELNPIKVVQSQNSFYEAELSSGTYSIFVETNGEKHCNSFGSKGEACQITVGKGEVKEYNIVINGASY